MSYGTQPKHTIIFFLPLTSHAWWIPAEYHLQGKCGRWISLWTSQKQKVSHYEKEDAELNGVLAWPSRTTLILLYLYTYPLRVTRHCRSPNFRKMSTTVSIGVWSVTVKGLRLRIRRSFSGWGLFAGSSGGSSVKYTMELLTTPSWRCLAFSECQRTGKIHTRRCYRSHYTPLLINKKILVAH